tara:strand:- start:9258 stop:9584 length:327 start_codon:yes stop_codon:yes gene_type:complete
MKTVIHVNQHVIRANKKKGENNPVITCKNYKSNTYAHEAIILDANGEEVARVVYRPNKPLPCGAHVWIETQHEVKTNNDEEYNQTCEAMDRLTNQTQDIWNEVTYEYT